MIVSGESWRWSVSVALAGELRRERPRPTPSAPQQRAHSARRGERTASRSAACRKRVGAWHRTRSLSHRNEQVIVSPTLRGARQARFSRRSLILPRANRHRASHPSMGQSIQPCSSRRSRDDEPDGNVERAHGCMQARIFRTPSFALHLHFITPAPLDTHGSRMAGAPGSPRRTPRSAGAQSTTQKTIACMLLLQD